MPNYICVACGNQYEATEEPPAHCLICEDERQYVNPEGQSWTTHDELEREHRDVLGSLEPGLTEIGTEPKFAIGQRALLVRASKGNVLWDCVSLIDSATIEAIEALGGISALAMSHPHMFGSLGEWSHAFGKVPIYLHVDYERWIQRPPGLTGRAGKHSLGLQARSSQPLGRQESATTSNDLRTPQSYLLKSFSRTLVDSISIGCFGLEQGLQDDSCANQNQDHWNEFQVCAKEFNRSAQQRSDTQDCCETAYRYAIPIASNIDPCHDRPNAQ